MLVAANCISLPHLNQGNLLSLPVCCDGGIFFLIYLILIQQLSNSHELETMLPILRNGHYFDFISLLFMFHNRIFDKKYFVTFILYGSKVQKYFSFEKIIYCQHCYLIRQK